MELVSESKTYFLKILNEEGEASENPGISEEKLKEMYHLMVLARKFDEKFFHLQRSGKIGTYAELKGQEACQVASAMACEKTDWFVPAFRELAFSLARGADRTKLVQAWNGDTRAFTTEPDQKDLPVAIPIASQLDHATGIAWASKIKKEKVGTICFFGDGATSEGDFHESLNFAGVFKLPIVYVCQNNGWAISTPRNKQTASKTIAQKAHAYGITGIQIDGNDVMAVYKATQEAMHRAKNGEGPTLIEMLTYRMGDHTTSDDSSKYRNPDDLEEWKAKDPIIRLKKYFEKQGLWNEEYGKWVEAECDKEVNEAIEKGLNVEKPNPDDLFEYVFETLPPDLLEQREELRGELQ